MIYNSEHLLLSVPSSNWPLGPIGPAWINMLCDVLFDFHSPGVKNTTAITCSFSGSLTSTGN